MTILDAAKRAGMTPASRDLCRLAADRVSASLGSVTQLCETPQELLQVAVATLAAPIGAAAGAYAAMTGKEPGDVDRRELLDAIFELMEEASDAKDRN